MNGRLYDPVLRRFLSPDNFVQDPYNTQNFNRYGYVYNSPLMFNDPSGEVAFVPILVGMAYGALVGAAVSVAVYTINGAITGGWTWGGLGTSMLYGAIGGAISGGLSGIAASMGSGASSFFQSATYNMMSEVASQVGAGVVMGENITFGTIAGSVAGGFVGAKFGNWSGVNGGWAKNAIGEIGFNTVKGGARGAVAGGVGATIDGRNVANGIVAGARNGALGGAAQSAAMIATFGATTLLTKDQSQYIDAIQEKYNFEGAYKVRRGGLYQLISSREVVWGNTIVANRNTTADTYGHEYGHIYQYYTQGWAQYQGRGIIEQFKDTFTKIDPYFTRGYNEFNAERMLRSVGGCSIPGTCNSSWNNFYLRN